jgi:5-methylcytosine-specific restriction protein A
VTQGADLRSCPRCGRTFPAGQRCPLHGQRRRSPSSVATRLPGWAKTRARVLARDRYVCGICGGPGADAVDHVVPASLGGTNHPSNLRAAHASCNARRGVRSL